MERRKFIRHSATLAAGVPFINRFRSFADPFEPRKWKISGPAKPVFIYNNWSAYDELSDHVAQTESLAMKELEEMVRLKKQGVQLEYYVMDAFWFDPAGGYRVWHKQHWPEGPDTWLTACKNNNIKPGMWFSTNLISGGGNKFLDLIPEWYDSAGDNKGILCLFEGGYLPHLSETLQIWYDKGVRLFKFDFAYFEAATVSAKIKYSPQEVKEKNKEAFINMLGHFREKNQEVLITGYNGFGGDMENTFTPFTKTIDPRWLDVFDTLYCGDPRFSDVPMMNIWRSQDNYSDHQVNAYMHYGLPISRIDNCAFMIGKTGTCYSRANQCWKGMLILELARGGWVNVYHGNLELLNNEDAKWFALVQRLFRELQQQNGISPFGDIPGKGHPYGFKAAGKKGMVCTIVNPSQSVASIRLPARETDRSKVLYADGGFVPVIKGNDLTLGPEQMAVVGLEGYADKAYLMGKDETVRIPFSIEAIQTAFTTGEKNKISGTVNSIAGKDIRIIFQQFDASGLPRRSWGGAPPNGKKMNALLSIKVSQEGKQIPLKVEYDKMIWSGLSWGAGEISKMDFDPHKPLTVECSSAEQEAMHLKANVYAVDYEGIASTN